MNIFILTAIWYTSQVMFLGWFIIITDRLDIYALWEIIEYCTIGIFLAIVGLFYINRCLLFTSLFSIILNVAILYHALKTTYTWLCLYREHTPVRKHGFLTNITYSQALALIEIVGWSIVLVLIIHNVLFYNLNCLFLNIF